MHFLEQFALVFDTYSLVNEVIVAPVRHPFPVPLNTFSNNVRIELADVRIEECGHGHAVPLKQPLPIYLVYFTAWEENGALRTVPDVYGLDRRHAAAATAQ